MNALRVAVRTVGELLITAGVVVLLFVAWQLWWTDVTAARAHEQIASRLEQQWGAPPAAPVAAEEPAAPSADLPVEEYPRLQPPALGEAWGIVRVPRFGADYAVPLVEGTGTEELQEGVGHYRGTAMPGEVGNVAVAGHRTTYGRPLHLVEDLQEGDAVVVETAEHWFTYRMRSSEVVLPGQVEVIAPVPGQPGAVPEERLLTLTTCHPMYSARQRFVVHAVLESVRLRSSGLPPALVVEG